MQRFQANIKTGDSRRFPLFSFIFLVVLLSTNTVFAQGRPPANVVVSPVVRETVQDQILLIGTVESWRSSQVAAEVSGRVKTLLARRGDQVKKGDLLAEIGASQLLLELKEFRARRNAALARLEKVEDNLKRSEALMKEGLLSEKAFREAKLSVRELKEDLTVNEAERLQLEDVLGKKRVIAPFDGIVTRELTEEGEWVSQGGGIIHLVDLSKARILVEMPEKYISHVKTGEPVTVQFDAVQGANFPGEVHALIPEGDRAARLFPLEVHVKNDDHLIKEGMLARVKFRLGLPRSVLMVDKDAITRKGLKTTLFLVQGEKVAQKIVTTGRAKKGLIEIEGNLKAGEKVVIRGNERLREGQSVRITSQDIADAEKEAPIAPIRQKQPGS